MISITSRLPQRLLTVAALTIAIALSGCQKEPDPNTATDTQNNDQVVNTKTAEPQTTEPEQSVNSTEQQQAPLTILALGDSLTEGLGVDNAANYPAQLEARLQELGYKNVKVVNSGLSGETSTGLVNRLDWVLQTKPDITILTVGANDAIRGIDVATVEANIRTAVQRLQDSDSEVILGGMQIYDNLGSDYVKSFAAIYPRVAKDMNVTLIPFFLDGVGGDPKLNQADAIHPTREGYKIIVNDNILPILQPEIEKLAESNMDDSKNSNHTNKQAPASTPAPTNTPIETTQ
ncbi:arylesterase [Psychrobacter sp. AOP22-C1-22]|uniref:arylesterase n=1 Tax=unclassified Psychrobacter TaxID=196806 RepID=UPI0017888768|nr:arylesterase [Psychrobacter sp. FME6]MBE0407748.1 arylesterase [Psychrobacter sp. FME6]MDN5801985.1 arylesterase [Psychrobacter sp.]